MQCKFLLLVFCLISQSCAEHASSSRSHLALIGSAVANACAFVFGRAGRKIGGCKQWLTLSAFLRTTELKSESQQSIVPGDRLPVEGGIGGADKAGRVSA